MESNNLENKFIVITFGLLFLIVGLYMLFSGNDKAKRCTVETTGEVVEEYKDLNTNSTSQLDYDRYTYYPIIEYKAEDEKVRKKYSVGYDIDSRYRVGETVTILYNPNNVEEYIIEGDHSSGLMGILFTAIGGFIVLAGIFTKNIQLEADPRG